jgi:outer membrane protein OmpA-like peptidoglycan-associated protein
MRHFTWTITCLSFAVWLPSAHAQTASKEETIGVGSGIVIGALAGGPVGAIVGSAIGAKLGDKAHAKNRDIDNLNASLRQSRLAINNLELDVRGLTADLGTANADLERLERNARPEAVKVLQAGIEMDLLFRTDESDLTGTGTARLADFANALAAMPDIRVQLDGFADERGDATYNHLLSEKRVAFVREQLLAAGVDENRITGTAHGEAIAIDSTADSYALERRVSLKVFIDDTPAFAASPR